MATGARRGELLGLRWSEIDLDEGVVRIRGADALDVKGGIVRKTTKSRKPRVLTIGASTVAHLRRWRTESAEDAPVLGGRLTDRHPVFARPPTPPSRGRQIG